VGDRRIHDGIDTVFMSDLHRAVETVEIAFAGSPVPLLNDWRLRECASATATAARSGSSTVLGDDISTSPIRARRAGGRP
jgi:hypothetical protein